MFWVQTSMGRRDMPTVPLVGNTERKGPRRRCEDDIETYLQEIRSPTLTHTTRCRDVVSLAGKYVD